jgi:type III secretory pathway lipoprotein EscJ
MEKEWVALQSCAFVAEAEVLKNLLLEHNIAAIVLNQKDSSYLSFGDVTLYVKNTDFIKAKNLLNNSLPSETED